MKLLQHLEARGLNVEHYNVVLDEETMTATFLLYTLSGKLAGYQQYKPEAPKQSKELNPRDLKYFTWVNKETMVFFGFDRYDPKNGRLYLVEGVFDAVALHNLGLNAVAVLGNSGKGAGAAVKDFLMALGVPTTAVVDGDVAGLELGKCADAMVVCPPGEDPASMSKTDLMDLLGLSL